jgi:CBS domain-containing protein/gamma-glutamylcysteine synthetase
MKEYEWVETELAKFNLEINLTPRVFEGHCLSDLHKENSERLNIIQSILNEMGVSLVLTGILPSLRKHHLVMENLTPKKRYFALMDAINEQLEGSSYELNLDGIDELRITHDSPLLEAVNTSFQVHLQVSPKEFVKRYNLAQAIAAPVLAIAANSPLVFGKRLWHESRIAMFQQALDTRGARDHMREKSARVSFGKKWLDNSILEIYKEDITRFRVLLSSDIEENSLQKITKGEVPNLRALQVHNSTVYRWNRPCYGISENGKPHLRIENRVFASGPTVGDEIANAAFWLGLMEGMNYYVDDIKSLLRFEDVSDNFHKAAKYGIDSKFNWFKDIKISAVDLISKELLPLARYGLESKNIASEDIDKYLGIIEERTTKSMNGARWLLRTFTDLKEKSSTDEAISCITDTMIKNQISGLQIHDWPQPNPDDLTQYRPSHMLVSEFMITDLVTVQEDDLVDYVADLMDWRQIRYAPVEDEKRNLIGLVTTRILIRHFLKVKTSKKNWLVKDIMIKTPLTVTQDTKIFDAMKIMRENKIGSLPVVNGTELVGIITEMDFLRISGRLIERLENKK